MQCNVTCMCASYPCLWVYIAPFQCPEAFENFSCRDDKYLKALLSDPNLMLPGRQYAIHLKTLMP